MGGHLKENFVILLCLFIFQKAAYGGELCDNRPMMQGDPLPDIPKYFKTNVQINDRKKSSTAEIIRVVDPKNKRDSVELWSSSTHVKYIAVGSENAFLTLNYDDKGASCKTLDLAKTNRRFVYETDRAWPLDILEVIETDVLTQPDNFLNTGADSANGISVNSWTFCDTVSNLGAEVRVTLFFTVDKWKLAYAGTKHTLKEIVRMQIEGIKPNGDEIELTAAFYNYQPFQPTDEDFQVPENVYCAGYQTNKKLPDMPIYFSYKSEKIQFGTAKGDQPVVSHRAVFYDTKSGIARVIYENPNLKDRISARKTSVIFDFNLGIKYSNDPETGACVMNIYDKVIDAVAAIDTPTKSMLDSKEFFALESENSFSYNGKYMARGIPSDLFSGLVTRNNEKRIHFWYFSTDRTKIIEGQEVETNVLLKMVTRPVSANGKQDQIELNFYDFDQTEPSASVFDITSCYNASQAKSFTLSFYGYSELPLKESSLVLQIRFHRVIQETADVSRQRVSVDKLDFQDSYFYVHFTVLDIPNIRGSKPPPKESSLETVVAKLQQSVSSGTFQVSFPSSSTKEIVLKPELDGLKEFKGEGNMEAEEVTYKEGSVVGVSIGMTVLGFLLGAVVINLVMSKKYGVSLFQKAGYLGRGAQAFDNPLNESAI